MPPFVSILRGINVSGHRKVPMAQLKALYDRLGLKQVTTYIQSGNVIFEAGSADGLEAAIEQAIQEEFGFDVPVMVRSQADWQQLIAGNPFLKEADADPAQLHLTLLKAMPDAALVRQLEALDFGADRCHIAGQACYLCIPESYGNTKLSNAFLENKLKVTATTRNWKTTLKLAELMA